jgi:hypothetical protein
MHGRISDLACLRPKQKRPTWVDKLVQNQRVGAKYLARIHDGLRSDRLSHREVDISSGRRCGQIVEEAIEPGNRFKLIDDAL